MFFFFLKKFVGLFLFLVFLKFHVVSSVFKNNFDSISQKKNVFETTKRFLSFFCKKKAVWTFCFWLFRFSTKTSFLFCVLVCMCFFVSHVLFFVFSQFLEGNNVFAFFVLALCCIIPFVQLFQCRRRE